ncbi:transcriptional regulator [Streptomyces sp. NPDC005955]|uniref:transcriptional regulator n=1 Tax=Streptomyces sp. NPDC005955 TaxID=3364738 RepID=UPI0036C568E8
MDVGVGNLGRRRLLGAGIAALALAHPGWTDLAARADAVRTGRAARVGRGEVRMVEDVTVALSRLDDRYGGRAVRPVAAAFLKAPATAALRADSTAPVRGALSTTVAFCAYLTGWMAMDEGRDDLARRHFDQALELARSADDQRSYHHVLRGMSVHAVDLGEGRTAVDLAEASTARPPQAGMVAFMTGQQAHAHAVAGDRAEAWRCLRRAERAMDRALSGAKTFGGYNPSTLQYHVAQVRHALGDTEGSVASLRAHFRLRDASDSDRSALRFGSMLAERQLQTGHLEAACTSWGAVLDGLPSMRSERVDQHVARIPGLLRPYLASSAARQLNERVRQGARP